MILLKNLLLLNFRLDGARKHTRNISNTITTGYEFAKKVQEMRSREIHTLIGQEMLEIVK